MSAPTLPSFISRSVTRGRYVFLDLHPSPGDELAVVCAGWEECSQGYEIKRNGFRFPAFEYIVGGTWELATTHGTWNLGPGSIFAYGPGIQYSLKATSKSGHGKYFVDLAGTSAAALLAKAGFKHAAPRRVVHPRWLHDLLDQLVETSSLRPAARKTISRMLVTLVLERIREDTRTGPVRAHALQSYEHCREFLARNYLAIHNLTDAARACGVAPSHLSRLFRRFDTQSPKDYLLRLKMNHAAELLLRNNLSVKQTAAEVGFDDAYHFSRCFKRVHGTAPSYFIAPKPGGK